jgi:hypothetical protein
MKAEATVVNERLKQTEEDRPREFEAVDAFAPLEPPNNRFGALLKAIEIWVQTR